MVYAYPLDAVAGVTRMLVKILIIIAFILAFHLLLIFGDWLDP